MVTKLFASFLDDPTAYSECERFWAAQVRDVEKSLGQSEEWKRWIPQVHPNGQPVERDGNPIFDGRSERLDRSFRIIQQPAVSDEVELAAWVAVYEPEFDEMPRAELFLNLSLSEESVALAKEALRKWMTPSTSVAEMNDFIRAVTAVD
ncbi:MAG: hypothetical protein Q8N23_02435 [Archangium sp.]|nr:hypothetical protein [Archangium sp.]MDP3575390.1 hypothetical protein [Archangium sp.]